MWGHWQWRNMLLTTKALYNLDGKVFKRAIPIAKIEALTKSNVAGDHNFIIHVVQEYDYRLLYSQQKEIVDQIKTCYWHVKHCNLPIYGVNDDIGLYKTTEKDAKDGVDKLPPEQFRLLDEDVFESNLDEDKVGGSKDIFDNQIDSSDESSEMMDDSDEGFPTD